MRLMPSSEALVKIAAVVLPNLKAITGVGVSCFASFFNSRTSLGVQSFPEFRVDQDILYSPFGGEYTLQNDQKAECEN